MTANAPPTQKTTLGIVMGILNVTNSDLGRRLGINTENVRLRRAGEVRLTLGDIRAYAQALGIPAEVLAMDVADVFRWFADHPDTAFTVPVTGRYANPQLVIPGMHPDAISELSFAHALPEKVRVA